MIRRIHLLALGLLALSICVFDASAQQIGKWSKNRSSLTFGLGLTKDADGAIAASFPSATWTDLDTLSAANLANLDLLILDVSFPNNPLSATEQTALSNFVKGGGTLLAAVWSGTAGGTSYEAAANAILAPFALKGNTALNGSAAAVHTVTQINNPVVKGPFGTVKTFVNRFDTHIDQVSSANAVALAADSTGPVLALLPRGVHGTGQALFFTNFHAFWDVTVEQGGTFNQGDNKALLLNLIASSVDSRPVADAGPDQTAAINSTVQLDGSNSSDDRTPKADLKFAWTIKSAPSGSVATLSGASTAMPTLVPDVAGDYTIDLIVTDNANQESDVDQVVITASMPNAAPTADAGSDATGATNITIQFDGSDSFDPNNDPLTYSWSLTSAPTGSAAMLVGKTTATPSLTPDLAGTYVLTLVVNDGYTNSAPDSLTLDVVEATDYARKKLYAADRYVRGLPLSAFYGSNHGSARHKARHQRWSKFRMRFSIRIAACQAQILARVAARGNARWTARWKGLVMSTIARTMSLTDGSTTGGGRCRSRMDLVVDETAAKTLHACLQDALKAVQAVK